MNRCYLSVSLDGGHVLPLSHSSLSQASQACQGPWLIQVIPPTQEEIVAFGLLAQQINDGKETCQESRDWFTATM